MADDDPKAEQPADTGAGPFLERTYCVDIARPRLSARALMHEVQCHLPDFSPDLLAEFKKTAGAPDCLRPGDEFAVKILGPWNGNVRVTDVAEDSFELATLQGHPEAGRIRFSARPDDRRPGVVRFEIRSWARSRDGLVAFFYDKLGAGKRVQEQTWRLFCEKVAERSGGEPLGPVSIETMQDDGHHQTFSKDA